MSFSSFRASAKRACPLVVILLLAGCLDSPTSNIPDAAGQPSLSGAPSPVILVDVAFVFSPTASDPDGDALTFSIQNKPTWASFDTDNGELSGVPVAGSEGVYSDIRISASDGINTATISFDIEVVTSGDASVSLSWDAPMENEDGTSLTDLAGYRIYYGDEEGNYPSVIDIDNPSVSSHVVENLLPKTYYFVATAYNSAGVESQHSNTVAKMAM